jgi:hypothetical protein
VPNSIPAAKGVFSEMLSLISVFMVEDYSVMMVNPK